MGKRASLFKCRAPGCGAEFWKWFEWLTREELIAFAEALTCPECGSAEWELTDTSEFAGGKLSGEAGYPHWIRQVDDVWDAQDRLGITLLTERVSALETTVDALTAEFDLDPDDARADPADLPHEWGDQDGEADE